MACGAFAYANCKGVIQAAGKISNARSKSEVGTTCVPSRAMDASFWFLIYVLLVRFGKSGLVSCPLAQITHWS